MPVCAAPLLVPDVARTAREGAGAKETVGWSFSWRWLLTVLASLFVANAAAACNGFNFT